MYVCLALCLCVLMGDSMYACVHVGMYVVVYGIMAVCLDAYPANVYVCVSVRYVCTYVWVYVCLHVCMHACMHVCVYPCMYVWVDGCRPLYVCTL